MAELPSGTLVDKRYRIVSRLGTGGMADVYLADDQQLGRQVALKLLHRRFAEDPGFVERFRREAQAAAGLSHPHVVSVYDRGAYDGTYYIAMEYVAGRSLKQLIRQEAPLDPARAVDITIQILKAARFAHRHGVIHRDLKPHNVIVDDAGYAKVTDFGIARAGASDMTETGSIMGTAQYLSPEQAQGHAVSAASDIYSVGVVLYELLTGQVPFDADAAVTIALKHVSEAPTAPTVLNPQVPPELAQVVMWALNKNPADRPADADQFITALEHARTTVVGEPGQRTAAMAAVAGVAAGGAGEPPPALAAAGLPEGPPPQAAEPGPDGAAVVPEEPPPARRRRRWPWAALLLLALLGGAIAAYLLTRPALKLVPRVTGEQLNIARAQLENAGFSVGVIDVTNANAPGTVIAQTPLGGTKAKPGSTVKLTVSQGPGSTTVPSVEGLPLAQAEQMIRQANLKVGRVVSQTSDQVGAGDVISTDPAAGRVPRVGTAVTIFVSSGKAEVTVPDVTGETRAQAKATLQGAGFSVKTTTQASSTVPAGSVISQSPAGNTQAVAGSTVTLVVAKAPPTQTTTTSAQAAVPDVTGQTADAATGALTAAGFTVTRQTKTVKKQKNDGVVLSQSPAGGTSANKGSAVTIVVGKFKPPAAGTGTGTQTNTTGTSSGSPGLP